MKLASLLFIALTATRLSAQQPVDTMHPASPAHPSASATATREVDESLASMQRQGEAVQERRDIIMPHITDAHHFEIPWPNSEWGKEIELPRWTPIVIGPVAVDLSPTKHVIFLLIAALLCAATLIGAARAHVRHSRERGRPKGFATGVEATVLYVRDEVILANVGPHGNGFVPYLLSVFFFILFANMLGLIPYGSTATGNFSVTAMLAIVSFLVIEIAGMRALGTGYLQTIFYWPSDEPFGIMKVVLFVILTPVELLGKFTKPFALAIRLFANMTAGHVIVLAFIGIIFTFGSFWIAPAPLAMAIGIMLLELLVAFIQAYLFTLLTAVFIGQIRQSHH
jgi:F-type H+-transporting ATPase subunit a